MKRLMLLLIPALFLAGCTDDTVTDADTMQFVDAIGNVATIVVDVNGRQVPCIVTRDALSCDWSAK
jgi:PBP1b-binding outer membrane lipoprotein LpoB